ncbi:MAG: flavodoxin [Nitrospiraceae bacterium]|nr:flavodoxin [Nitrospiraceae bacterium]
MKTLIVCVSVHHGNTRKIAKAMAEVLDAELRKPDEVNPDDIKNYGLIGFGSGIYFGKHHKSLLRFVDKLDGNGKNAFIFSTSGYKKLPLINNFDKSLVRRLSRRGFSIIGSFNCKGQKAYYNNPGMKIKPLGGMEKNRPNQEDIENAKRFAKSMKNKVME